MNRYVPTMIKNITETRWVGDSTSIASAATPPGVSISIIRGSRVWFLTARSWSFFSAEHCMVEFNEIPWQKMGDKGYYGSGNPGRRLAGIDDRPIRFWAVPVSACTWLLKIFVAHPLLSERPDNTVAFPLISWNGSGQGLMFARPALIGLLWELETKRSRLWQAWC